MRQLILELKLAQPQAILTDRAICFFGTGAAPSGMTTYQLALDALGIRAAFAAPYKPRTKGSIERFFQYPQPDFLAEVRHRVKSLDQLNTLLGSRLDSHNRHRPRAGLGHSRPARQYGPNRRPAPAQLNSVLAVESARRVARDATIAFRGKRLAVPPEYLGQHVWLQLLGDHITIRANNQIIAEYSATNL